MYKDRRTSWSWVVYLVCILKEPLSSATFSLEREFNGKLCGIRIGTYMGSFNDDQLLANFIHRKRARSFSSWIMTFIPQVCLIHSC